MRLKPSTRRTRSSPASSRSRPGASPPDAAARVDVLTRAEAAPAHPALAAWRTRWTWTSRRAARRTAASLGSLPVTATGDLFLDFRGGEIEPPRDQRRGP